YQAASRQRSYLEGGSGYQLLRGTAKSNGCAMAAKRIGHELSGMKKIKLLSLVSTALVGLTQPVWAGPHGGGGGFAGGGHFGGGFRAAPAFSGGGARFGGRSVGGLARGSQFYYGGGRMSAVRSYGFTGSA